MANVIDYIEWRGDLTFTQSPLNEIDNVLFVFLTFIDFDGIVPSKLEGHIQLKEAVKRYFSNLKENTAYYGAIMPNRDIENMAKQMAKSNRFANVKLTGYVNEVCEDSEKQFSAYTAILNDGSIFVSFKGTDDSLVGWKEDMNMALSPTTPGQLRAVDYLDSVSDSIRNGKIRVGGHSKGGNFSVYAAACCKPETQRRIARVYNNDGPGFSKKFLESESYLKIKPLVLKLVPQESIIGMMLGNDDNYTVVNSRKTGVVQHNCFLWDVKGRHFVRRSELTRNSLETSRILNKWIEEKDIETRKALVEAAYEILTSSNAKTLTDIAKDRTLILRSLAKIDPKKREMVLSAIMNLLKELLAAQISTTVQRQRKNTNGDAKK